MKITTIISNVMDCFRYVINYSGDESESKYMDMSGT